MEETEKPELDQKISKQSETLSEISEKLAAEKRDRNEERIVWILVGLVLFDATVLSELNILQTFVLLIFELLLLLILAEKWGNPRLVLFLRRLLHRFSGSRE